MNYFAKSQNIRFVFLRTFNSCLELFFNFFPYGLFDFCNDLWIGDINRYLHVTDISFNTCMNRNMRFPILHLGRYTCFLSYSLISNSFFLSQLILISVPWILSRIHTVPLAGSLYSQSTNFPCFKTAIPEARSVASGALS